MDKYACKVKKNKPEYLYIKEKDLGVYNEKGLEIKIIAGKFKNVEGPEKNHNVEPIYFHIKLNQKKQFNYKVPNQHNAFIYLLKGDLEIGKDNKEKTNDSQLILLEKGNDLNIVANKNSEFLFIAGKPIGEKNS